MTQHEAEITLDRISTREELCEVIDLLNDGVGTPEETSARKPRRKQDTEKDAISAESAYAFDDKRDGSEDAEEIDELSAKLARLFADESDGLGWIN